MQECLSDKLQEGLRAGKMSLRKRLTDAVPSPIFKAERKVHRQERDTAKYHKG